MEVKGEKFIVSDVRESIRGTKLHWREREKLILINIYTHIPKDTETKNYVNFLRKKGNTRTVFLEHINHDLRGGRP